MLSSSPSLGKLPVVRCRTERGQHLPHEQYTSDTCARCYRYMPALAFREKLQYNGKFGALFDPSTNTTHYVGSLNVTQEVLSSFLDNSFADKWRACCSAAWHCCNDMAMAPTTPKGYCPRTWDGWQCWPDAEPGTVSREPCQDHIYFENGPPSCVKNAHKTCLPNGTWYMNENFREWTNYSTCGRKDEHRRFLNFHIATYVISIVSIVPALILFLAYKQLQVPRISMHKNLFLSLLLNGLCSVLFKAVVVGDELNRHQHYDSIMERNGYDASKKGNRYSE
ncbi:hypothetical protein JTE90_017539 [Oedothorax gibbosus]|uniref:G-protein coupled receptors family 2 profile 1 domain-containing protein n=1 Tax=Oedothorax gibbosus TaxID=931172 RepID=A0AAV6TWV0_9ARAC|nr:hypothetical protein JTE90_017539 [Oedothorax gibbosus]